MQRYFVDDTYTQMAPDFVLKGSDYHHVANVMRMSVGAKCYLVFRDGVALVAEITTIDDQQVLLKEIAKETQGKELPLEVTIACAYPKGDKLDLVVQKGTELGASAFKGFPGKTSVVKWDQKKLNKRHDRLQKIAKEAAEQSHRHVQPEVTLYPQFTDFSAIIPTYDAVLVAYEESAKQGEQGEFAKTIQQLTPGQRLLIIFGPEGGFSPQEIEQYQALGSKLCGLGPRILRAETAPLYVLSAISYQWELLN